MTVRYSKFRVFMKSWLKWGLVASILVASLISSIVIESKMAYANTATATPGSTASTTKLMLTPLKTGDTFQYLISQTTIGTLPVTGVTLTALTAPYKSGSDIISVDVTTNKYIDVYEVDKDSKIVAFKEFTLTASNIAAPAISTTPIAAVGTTAGSTKLALTANNTGDTFKVQAVSKPTTILPGLGTVASGKVYTTGSDLTGVDATKNKYVNIYEVDGTGKIVAFTEITLTASEITAPVMKTTATPGSAASTTKLTLTPLKTGDTFQYLISISAISILPVTGGTLPNGTTAYTTGSAIIGVTTNNYIDVYEVDGTSIVAFKEITLTGSNIAAPAISSTPTAAAGTTAGSTKLALTANNTGDTFKVQAVSKPTTILPGLGTVASGKVYTTGSDLTGVDATKNKYVNIYEVDGTGKIVAFTEITLTASDVTAPVMKTTATPGSAASTTKLTLTPLKTGDTFQYLISTSAISILPVTGGTLPNGTTAYTTGSAIIGVTTNNYIDVYEVDGTSIVAFKEITLTGSNIAAPAISSTPTAAAGTTAGSTKLALTANNTGDTFKVQAVSKPTTILPGLGTVASGKVYTTGSDLTGVDATKNKYVNIYEVDGTGKIVAFSEITLTASEITAPSL